MVDHRRIDDTLADGGGDFQLEDEDRDEVEEGGPHHGVMGFEHAGRDDGGDRVRRVVETVHEVEHERQRHQER